MLIWHSFAEAERWAAERGTALTIGTFDGVHLGHQAVITELRRQAGARSLPPVVITFIHHPSSVIGGETPPFIIPLARRLELLASLGLEAALVIPFDQALAGRAPEEFVRDCLWDSLKVRLIVVGHDFRFGAGGRGDAALLAALGGSLGMEVMAVPPVMVDGIVVSSTAIRWALAAGDVVAARRYMGRPFSVRGEVVPGEKRGRRLGFPTANLRLEPEILRPRYGVYLVEVTVGQKRHYGVADVGVKPTFGLHEPAVEVFLFDCQADLYRTEIEVFFLRFLRPERRFASAEELRAQIALDVAQAKSFLAEDVNRQ